MILRRLVIYSLFLALTVAALPSRMLCQSDPYRIKDMVTEGSKFIGAGSLSAGANNEGPEFEPISTKLVNEGETFVFSVTARDPEGGVVRLHCGKLPPMAKFMDNGNGTGTFSWSVPYLGPGSASGSPFLVSFVATDGAVAVQIDVPIEAININRPPQISTSGSVTAFSGDSVFIPLTASDPDLESITFSASKLPIGAEIHSGNPGYIIWGSSLADSGSYGLDVEALDESGGVAHKQIALKLLATLPIELSLSNEQAFTNEVVTIPINLHNHVDVAGFHLLIEYDPSLLISVSLMSDSVRTGNWYPFTVQGAGYGRLLINGHADPAIPGSNPLLPGDGAVAYLRFMTCPDPDFAGQFSRIEFRILDSLNNTENIIFLPDGTILPRSQVSLTSGSVLIKKYDALIGDLNLNLVPMEIGDAVYFTNYFLSPIRYPLNGARWINSDVNQNGVPGTVGDLVYLLRIIVGDVPKINANTGTARAESELEATADGLVYKLNSNREIAGALITFRIDGDDPVDCVPLPTMATMELRSAHDGSVLRVLVLSSKGNTFTAGGDGLFQLMTNSSVELMSQEIVDVNGAPIVLASVVSGGTLPQGFDLEQNCPNPFNPETAISYSLEEVGDVSLDVYNCLGQRVRILFTGNQPTGTHTVRFDGTDDAGAQLASGVYLYRLRVGDRQLTRKMVLLK